MNLLQVFHHHEVGSSAGRLLERHAARAIVLHGREILLLYTKRYDDYSLPGGGVDAGESMVDALHRELQEETGAAQVSVIRPLGYIDEYRPPRKEGYDVMFMRSHFFLCKADRVLGNTQPEHYEIANGMTPIWIDINQAIAHNEQVLSQQPGTMGLSIERETWMLRYIVHELLGDPGAPFSS
ncbi:NUDIX hydrolase [Duganella sp. LjRoot269]|uniref:NUDIX hydrolase n=1 Tax=Duganella sp. LjRoot269 TaxID=3342305 RepID=UPI003ECEB931